MVEGAAFLCLCHDDVELDPDAVHQMVRGGLPLERGHRHAQVRPARGPRRAAPRGAQRGPVRRHHRAGRARRGRPGPARQRAGRLRRPRRRDPRARGPLRDARRLRRRRSWRWARTSTCAGAPRSLGSRIVVAPTRPSSRTTSCSPTGARPLTAPVAGHGGRTLQSLTRRHRLSTMLTCYGWLYLVPTVAVLVAPRGGRGRSSPCVGRDRERIGAVVGLVAVVPRAPRARCARGTASSRRPRALDDHDVRRLQVAGASRLQTFGSRLVHEGVDVARGALVPATVAAVARDATSRSTTPWGSARPSATTRASTSSTTSGTASTASASASSRRSPPRWSSSWSSRCSSSIGVRNLVASHLPLVGRLAPLDSWWSTWRPLLRDVVADRRRDRARRARRASASSASPARSCSAGWAILPRAALVCAIPLGAFGIWRLLRGAARTARGSSARSPTCAWRSGRTSSPRAASTCSPPSPSCRSSCAGSSSSRASRRSPRTTTRRRASRCSTRVALAAAAPRSSASVRSRRSSWPSTPPSASPSSSRRSASSLGGARGGRPPRAPGARRRPRRVDRRRGAPRPARPSTRSARARAGSASSARPRAPGRCRGSAGSSALAIGPFGASPLSWLLPAAALLALVVGRGERFTDRRAVRRDGASPRSPRRCSSRGTSPARSRPTCRPCSCPMPSPSPRSSAPASRPSSRTSPRRSSAGDSSLAGAHDARRRGRHDPVRRIGVDGAVRPPPAGLRRPARQPPDAGRRRVEDAVARRPARRSRSRAGRSSRASRTRPRPTGCRVARRCSRRPRAARRSVLSDDVVAAMRGETVHLGRLLATAGIAYVVVVSATAPALAGQPAPDRDAAARERSCRRCATSSTSPPSRSPAARTCS